MRRGSALQHNRQTVAPDVTLFQCLGFSASLAFAKPCQLAAWHVNFAAVDRVLPLNQGPLHTPIMNPKSARDLMKLVSETHPEARGGHLQCCRRKIAISLSHSDPNVWSGRAVQEVFVDPAVRSRINVSGL
jgi:hypothetical protein